VELCCPCVCPAICVTFTPSDYDCEPESVELDWEDAISGYRGTLAGHDLYYYIERDPPPPGKERGPCKFKLRSESLGYPEGYEYEWEIPCDPYDEEVPCTTCLALETELGVPADAYRECSGGTLTTRCVEWIMPRLCDNCVCLCECICVFVTKDGIAYSGKACWSEYEQAYEGDVEGLDAYGQAVSLGVSVPIARWGDVCDPDTDYDCDPYSDDCAIRLEIIDGEDRFESAWQKMAEPCQLRAVTYSFHIERDPYNDADDIEASVRCATCNEDCEPLVMACCPNPLPSTLYATLTTAYGNPGDITYLDLNWITVPLRWAGTGGDFIWRGIVTTNGPPHDTRTDKPYTLKISVSCDSQGDPSSFGVQVSVYNNIDELILDGTLAVNAIEDCNSACDPTCFTDECISSRGYICCDPFYLCGYGGVWYLESVVVTE